MVVAKRMTKQKRVIMAILEQSKEHPTAEMVYNEARKIIPDISLGTVYRNLQVLREEGMILELTNGKGVSRYDGCTLPHHHFICEKCGSLKDVELEYDEELNSKVNDKGIGKVNSHRLVFYGICDECENALESQCKKAL